MNKNILKKYYEMQGKVILPEQKDNNNVELAASVAANFASIGFPMTTEQTKHLAKAIRMISLHFLRQTTKCSLTCLELARSLLHFILTSLKAAWNEIMQNIFLTRLSMVCQVLNLNRLFI